MAVMGNKIVVRIGLEGLADFRQKMKNASFIMRKAGNQMRMNGEQLSKSVTLPIVGVGAAALTAFAKFEKMSKGLESIMGSTSAAQEELKQLRKVAQMPGLSFDQAVRGSVRLQAVGFSADLSRRALSEFGNALALAGGSAADLDGVSLALTQIASKGKISAEEINQLAERVPQIRTAMQDAFGTADTEQLQKMGIGAEEFVERVVDAFGKLPRAQNTLSNAFVNLQQSVTDSLVSIGQSIDETFDVTGKLQKLGEFVGQLADKFNRLTPQGKKTILMIAGVAAAIGPVLFIMGQLVTTVSTLGYVLTAATGPVGLVIGALAALAAGVIYVYDNWEAVKERFMDIGWWVNTLVSMVQFLIKYSPFGLIIKGINAVLEFAGKNPIPDITEGLASGLDSLKVKTKEYKHEFGTFGEAVSNAASGAAKSLGIVFDKTKAVTEETKTSTSTLEEFKGGYKGLEVQAEESLKKIKKLFNSAPMQLINDFVMGWYKGRVTLTETIVDPFRDAFDLPTSIGITEIFKKTRDKIKTYFDSGAFDFINKAVFGVGEEGGDEQEGGEMPEWMGKVQEYAAMAQQALGGLFDFWGQSIANRREKMNQYYDEEIAKIEASAMTEKKKQEAITKLNEERAKKERKLAREEAKRNKAQALFQAVIQGALAVVQALASGPQGVVMAAIVGGIAAAQIAAIAAEPLPALAEGGLAYGPTMALVGDNVGAKVDPEVISPLSKLKEMMGGQQDIRLSGAFRIQGQDLVLALEEANQIRVRR